jgi:hypothetical protein
MTIHATMPYEVDDVAISGDLDAKGFRGKFPGVITHSLVMIKVG